MHLRRDLSFPPNHPFVRRVNWPVATENVSTVTYFAMDKLTVMMDLMNHSVIQNMIQMLQFDVICPIVHFRIVFAPLMVLAYQVTCDLKKHLKWSFLLLMMQLIMKIGKFIKKYFKLTELMPMDALFRRHFSCLTNTPITEMCKNCGMMDMKLLFTQLRKCLQIIIFFHSTCCWYCW